MPSTSTTTRSVKSPPSTSDDETGRPEWLAIRTGLFRLNTSFAPISGATVRDGQLHLPYTKDQVRDAPNVKPNGYLTPEEERDLFDHYGFAWDARSYGSDAPRFDADYDLASQPMLTEPSEVAEMTCSEEQLRVATEGSPPAGPVCASTSSPSTRP